MTSAHTIEVKVYVDDALHEFLIAELADLEFESFVEGDGFVLAYTRARDWNAVARETIERWLNFHNQPVQIEETDFEPENWNRKWEETIRPVVVGRFLIKPTWCDVPQEWADRILLEIDPKMSFGTGYHESTRLALRLFPDFIQPGARVLDAGTGTGVLAIAAARLGASSVFAFDVDEWSYTNAMENVYLNHVPDQVTVASGSLDVAPPGPYDLILANINRGVLIDMLPRFSEMLLPAGAVVLAGLLQSDRELMLRHAKAENLAPVREDFEGEWWSVVLQPEAR